MSALKFTTPGLLTTVQDNGRVGYSRYGVPECGALDRDSLRIANALVGNVQDTAALEIRFLGPSFVVNATRVRAAICGAEVDISIFRGDVTFSVYQDRTFVLEAGDRVSIGRLKDSTTAYLAVDGGFAVEKVLGSASTDLKSSIGGWFGGSISADTELPVNLDFVTDKPDLAISVEHRQASSDPIRVIAGPQQDYFAEEVMDLFVSAEWKLTKNADRMGMRLEGPELEHAKGYNIVSDGIANGAIQVPGNKQPIILLADRQTSGGYPKIATVLSCDLPRLGRLAPGSTLRFEWISPAEGILATRRHEEQIQRILESIKPYHAPGEINQQMLNEANLISPPVELE